jgi:hypothetical protein
MSREAIMTSNNNTADKLYLTYLTYYSTIYNSYLISQPLQIHISQPDPLRTFQNTPRIERKHNVTQREISFVCRI